MSETRSPLAKQGHLCKRGSHNIQHTQHTTHLYQDLHNFWTPPQDMTQSDLDQWGLLIKILWHVLVHIESQGSCTHKRLYPNTEIPEPWMPTLKRYSNRKMIQQWPTSGTATRLFDLVTWSLAAAPASIQKAMILHVHSKWLHRETNNNTLCYIAGLFSTTHMTSNNETVSRQIPWAGNIAKTMMSNGKQFTITRKMLTADACDQRWPDVVAGISARFFYLLLYFYAI